MIADILTSKDIPSSVENLSNKEILAIVKQACRTKENRTAILHEVLKSIP